MGDLLGTLLETANLPGRVGRDVVSQYGARYGDELAKNLSVGRHAGALLAELDMQGMTDLVASGSKIALERVLTGIERRASVVVAAMDNWELSARDQVRLAGSVRGPKTSDEVLRGDYVAAAQEVVYAQASAGAQVEWLARTGQIERLWAVLGERGGEVRMHSSVIAALLLTPELRGLALRSEHAKLRLAACWTELDLDQHGEAARVAMAMGMTGDPLDPVAGLLNQPGLDWDVRLELEEFQTERAALLRAAALGEGVPRRDYHNKGLSRRHWAGPGEHVADLDGMALNSALRAAGLNTRGTYSSRERAITTTLLFGLSENENLDEANRRQVLKLVVGHNDWREGTYNPALKVAFERMAKRMHLTEAGVEEGPLKSVTVKAIRRVQAPQAPRSAPKAQPRCAVWRDGDRVLGDTRVGNLGGSTDNQMAQARRIGQMAHARFGAGTTVESRASWRYFFSLVEHSPQIVLREVLDMAEGLGQAEEHD